MANVQTELEKLIASLKGGFENAKNQLKSEGKDPRFLTVPKGKTIVRLLPPSAGLVHPWIKKFIHMFESAATGQLITFDCPYTFKQPCAICNNNHRLWNAGDEASKKLSGKYKRKATYAANVYVKESKEVDEVGQVKIYRFGKKVFEKFINGLELHGMFYSPDASGADFAIVRTEKAIGGGQTMPDYDSSTFLAGSPLAKTPAEIMEIIKSAYDLKEFEARIDDTDPQLKNAFEVHVLGNSGEARPAQAPMQSIPQNNVPAAPAADPMPEWDNAPKSAAKQIDEEDADFLAELEKEISG